MKNDLTRRISDIFSESQADNHLRFVDDVRNGRVKKDPPPPTKPEMPSLKGKKINIHYKDPEAVSSSVEYFVDNLLKKVKNRHLVRDEVYEAVYKAIGKFGEEIDIEVDLDTGKYTVKP